MVRWWKRPKSPFSIAQRTRIVLLAAEGLSNNAVADKVGANQATVVKWRERFIERRLDGLVDEPRPGAPRTITDADVEAARPRPESPEPGPAGRDGHCVDYRPAASESRFRVSQPDAAASPANSDDGTDLRSRRAENG